MAKTGVPTGDVGERAQSARLRAAAAAARAEQLDRRLARLRAGEPSDDDDVRRAKSAAEAATMSALRQYKHSIDAHLRAARSHDTAADSLGDAGEAQAARRHRQAAWVDRCWALNDSNAAAVAVHRRAATPVSPAVSPSAAPSSLRRAVDFIDANATTPITLTNIAQAIGVSGRALQLAFRRYLSVTPIEYLRWVRLEAARRELEAADATSEVTVAEIARRHGFTAPGRFTRYYRQAFGVTPSQTLRG